MMKPLKLRRNNRIPAKAKPAADAAIPPAPPLSGNPKSSKKSSTGEPKPGPRRLRLMEAKAEPAPQADAERPASVPETLPARDGGRRRETAESMASRQREISVSEFFTKNRHLLGFDNPQKALLTAIKEAVDNSLDACEEGGILPSLEVDIQQLAEDRFRIAVEDNGPGIVKAQIPKIFGKLLYGSKFHTLKQSRGQQGIGISAAGMYGLLTTGKSIAVTSRTAPGKPAHYYEIQIDTRKNVPQVINDKVVEWQAPHGTRVEIELVGTYKKGRRSVDDYIRQAAIANPHAEIRYKAPDAEVEVFARATETLPREPR